MKRILVILICFGFLSCATEQKKFVTTTGRVLIKDEKPKGRETPFVSLEDLDSEIVLDIRFAKTNNFVGRQIRGYRLPKCLLTQPAADALLKVQAELKGPGFSLKVFDCFRPQRAVDDIHSWANETNNKNWLTLAPNPSAHSRGSTVDVTIVTRPSGEPSDMGTEYFAMDPKNQTDHPNVKDDVRTSRVLLRMLMEKYGFRNDPKKWWQYTLTKEPYPNRNFDFPVE